MAISIQHDGVAPARSSRWIAGPSLKNGAAATVAALLVAALAGRVGLAVGTLSGQEFGVLGSVWGWSRTLPLWSTTAFGAIALWAGLASAYDAMRSWMTPRSAQDVVWWVALSGIGALALVDPMVATGVASAGFCAKFAQRDRWWPTAAAALIAALAVPLGAVALLLLAATAARRRRSGGAWAALATSLATLATVYWFSGVTTAGGLITAVVGVAPEASWALPLSSGAIAQTTGFGGLVLVAGVARRAPVAVRLIGALTGVVGLLVVCAGGDSAIMTFAATPLFLAALLLGGVTERTPELARPVWLAAVLSSAYLYVAGSSVA